MTVPRLTEHLQHRQTTLKVCCHARLGGLLDSIDMIPNCCHSSSLSGWLGISVPYAEQIKLSVLSSVPSVKLSVGSRSLFLVSLLGMPYLITLENTSFIVCTIY